MQRPRTPLPRKSTGKHRERPADQTSKKATLRSPSLIRVLEHAVLPQIPTRSWVLTLLLLCTHPRAQLATNGSQAPVELLFQHPPTTLQDIPYINYQKNPPPGPPRYAKQCPLGLSLLDCGHYLITYLRGSGSPYPIHIM